MIGGVHSGYGAVNDEESISGLRLVDELGARLFDTAAPYGGGHSERLLGQVFGVRDDIFIVTKFGMEPHDTADIDRPELRTSTAIRASAEQSRKNLRRDRLDLLLFHVNGHPPEQSVEVFDTLDDVGEGRIAAYGWSNDSVTGVSAFSDQANFIAVENDFNVFMPASELMAYAEAHGLLSINRLPLAMGMLTGKYNGGKAVGADDIRAAPVPWMTFFKDGVAHQDYVRCLEAIRELLTVGGRSLAQGALCWILARSPVALPVPGFKTPAQIRDNLGALEKGPLPPSVMLEIEVLLQRA